MPSGRDDFHSVTGRPETKEPTQQQRITSPTIKRDASSSSSIPTLRKQSSASFNTSSPSAGNSPQTSRNTSPIRQAQKQEAVHTTSRAGGLRSRKNSHDASPSRPPSMTPSAHSVPSVPSAAAIQRALSASTVPQLQPGPVTEAVSKLPRTSRNTPASEPNTPATGQFSPRIRSPPPSAPASRRNSLQRKADGSSAPPITVQTPTPPNSANLLSEKSDASTGKEQQLHPPQKVPTRGPSGPKSSLETVQEATPPAASILASATDQSFSSMNSSRTSDDDRGPAAVRKNKNDDASESDGNRSDGKVKKAEPGGLNLIRPKNTPGKSSIPPTPRSRQAEGSRNMTVETETVSSIPQSALSADRSAGSRGDASGSVRLKASNETIRPKKERKRASRKTHSLQNGTASSKADIFEARVASVVDEANSSDSDETFVYESNPPEPQHRSQRHHSRTPSTASAHSANDRRRYGNMLDNHRVAGKRSMKFSNNPYNVLDNSPPEGEGGTVRAHQSRHISRFGRTMGSHTSLQDQESPFTQASKLRVNLATSTRQSSRPTTPQTPKTAPLPRGSAQWGRKNDLSQYDFDGEGADDERTPLVGTVRMPRNARQRRSAGGRSVENIYNIRHSSWMSRFGGAMLGFVVVLLILVGASGFLLMSNKSMYEVEVSRIENVLASEQELMLDLLVGAINPNFLALTVTNMDVNIFAKSSHLSEPPASSTPSSSARQPYSRGAVAGTPWQDPSGHWGDDHGGQLEGDSQTMLLGRIFHFDQALFFEGSPLKRHTHYSVGELRLPKPGNRTESGGSARWERVLQYPFELIIRGVLQYELPISNRAESSRIYGSVLVHPEEGLDSLGRMRLEDVDPSEKWQWVEHSDLDEGRK